MSSTRPTPRDLWLAAKAKAAGANYSLRIILECRRAGVPISAGFALIEGESNFTNVFGHDPVANIRGGKVTKERFLEYKRRRKAGQGMQGVGPPQLTWYEFQDRADALGGCWIPKYSIRVGIDIFASYYKGHKRRGLNTREALRLSAQQYNGAGAAAVRYGWNFLDRYDKWHRRFDG